MCAVGVGADGKVFYTASALNVAARKDSRLEGSPVWAFHCVGNWPSVILALYITCMIFSVCEGMS